jgi:small subunit ribosomal protein S16
MVKIRLRRTGAKKQPTYRVVVADSHSPRDGRFIEIIGHYNPRTEPPTVNIQEDRALHWLSVGAQMTETVQRLLKNLGTLDRFARLKEGAALEGLLAEAEATRARNVEEAKAQAKKASKEKKEQKQAKVEEEATEPEAKTSEETETSEEVEAPEEMVSGEEIDAESSPEEATLDSEEGSPEGTDN